MSKLTQALRTETSTPSSPISASAAAACAAAAHAAVVARDAALRRLCRVSTSYQHGGPVRIYEVREPTPENLATVSQLLRKAHQKCHQTSGIVFVASA